MQLLEWSVNSITQHKTALLVFFFFLNLFLGLHMWHVEVPRLGVQLELQLPAYTTATAMPAPNPLSEARDRTHNLTVPSWIHPDAPRRENSILLFLKKKKKKKSAFGFREFPYLKMLCFTYFCFYVIISFLWVTQGITGF